MLHRRQHDHGEQNRHHENQITREIGELGRQPDAEMIEDRLGRENDSDADRLLERPPGGDIDLQHIAEDQIDEQRVGADIDRGDDENETDQIDPGRGPTPAAPAQNRRPVIEPARRRIGGGDLRHRGGDDHRIQAAEQPADADRKSAARRESGLERGDAAGKDANDRERNREIRENVHAAGQLLRISHLVQRLYVVLKDCFFFDVDIVRHCGPPPL